MKRLLHYLFLGCVLFPGMLACMPSQKGQDTAGRLFPPALPIPPDSISIPEERASYIVNNVWLPYDSLTTQMFEGIPSMEQFIVDYFAIGAVADKKSFSNSVVTALGKSTPDFYAHFLDFAEMYLDHSNSPIYNEDLYALFVGQVLRSSVVTYADSIRLSERLTGYAKNKVGDIAANFSIRLSDSRKISLHDIASPLTILIFYEPECETCIETLDLIKSSDVFLTLAAEQKVKVLCVDMTSETRSAQSAREKCPTWMMMGYESEQAIRQQQLYYLRAFPTVFLLDQDNRVLLRHLRVDQLEQWLRNNT
ncbi:AhpC/TSA family [Porphyromonas cangingivalis]|uniref:DUF5106 domain-containing protein n=1 Tax=Porphyromonas cangingivalis TaxID=36874 RepID=UPI000D82CEF3|nr:DUF5106 domain-containing protein [Porphyromonas cangingivalis]SPY34845.1 AhpC/TSA family [Porphyromonas cangingivalis]